MPLHIPVNRHQTPTETTCPRGQLMRGRFDLPDAQEFQTNDLFLEEEIRIYMYLESLDVKPVNVQDYVRESLSFTSITPKKRV